jgi:hypothetical protein
MSDALHAMNHYGKNDDYNWLNHYGAYILECDVQRNEIFTDTSCDYKGGVYDLMHGYRTSCHYTES